MQILADKVETFIGTLESRATQREKEGANTALAYRSIAAELRTKLDEWMHTALKISEAVEVSGYSKAQLNNLRRQGLTTFCLCDLPIKPRPRKPALVTRARVSKGKGSGKGAPRRKGPELAASMLRRRHG
jgi:hypothetical protein